MAFLSANILVCERVLLERDNVPTLVRIVDLFYVAPETPKFPDGKFPPVGMFVYATIAMTADDDDEHEVSFILVRPDGSITPINTAKQKAGPSRVDGTHRSLIIAAQLGVNPTHHGGHEFRLIFDGNTVATAWFVISLTAAPQAVPMEPS